MKETEKSLFRGFCVFSEKGNLFHNNLRCKHFSRIRPQNHCKVRHFRDSEKRLPCGIRTVALRRRSGKNFRFFQKNKGQFDTLPGNNPDRDICRQRRFFIIFPTKFRFLLSTCRKKLNIRDRGFCLQGFPKSGERKKNCVFFQKTGAKIAPWVAITPIEGKDITGVWGGNSTEECRCF